MNIPQLFEQSLASASSSGGVVAAGAAPNVIRCDVVELSPLAVKFNTLILATDQLANSTVDELLAISQELSNRVTYLLEPIGPIEVDGDKCVIQMRSTPPSANDAGLAYYELLVERGGTLNLARYEKCSGNARQSVPATVTQEVLNRLVTDFCGVVGLA